MQKVKSTAFVLILTFGAFNAHATPEYNSRDLLIKQEMDCIANHQYNDSLTWADVCYTKTNKSKRHEDIVKEDMDRAESTDGALEYVDGPVSAPTVVSQPQNLKSLRGKEHTFDMGTDVYYYRYVENIPIYIKGIMMGYYANYTYRPKDNLLDNAVKFTPAGGKIQIKGAQEGRYIRVDVIDNGPGISSEHLSRVFERFWRADKARSQETGGTGLGLSIVKHIVDMHRGRISVESALGRGTRFSVFLPLDMI